VAELAATSEYLQTMKETESIYRKNVFHSEKARILANSDVFVSAPGVSATDVEKERQRLIKLEEAGRKRAKTRAKEENKTAAHLLGLKSVMLLQRIYRGHLGRRKYRLSQRLKVLEKKEKTATELVWIEVRDNESGDVWYYNKSTGLSQWEKPDDMFSIIAPKENVKNIQTEQASPDKGGHQESKYDKLKMTMALPSKAAVAASKTALSLDERKKLNEEERQKQNEAQKEVNREIGVDKIRPQDAIFAPDGTFRPQLRTTVLDALLETRFDNVSTVLADQRWMEQNKNPFQAAQGNSSQLSPSRVKENKARKGMVSMMKIGQTDKSMQISVQSDDTKDLQREHLTVTDLQHPGFNDGEGNRDISVERKTDDDGPFIPGTMCFGCWSSGAKRKCALHVDPEGKVKPSETMLLCRNWELGVMRRRYRSEEIQEIFMKKGSSLRYDVKRKAFLTVVEQRH